MPGPYSIEEIEHEIYLLVVSSKTREGQGFPAKYVHFNMEKDGYTHDDFSIGVKSLQEKGLITEDEKISNDFFDILGSA